MTKRLVYFYYIDEDKYSHMQLHLACLKHYANVFDEALFVLSTKNLEDKDNIDKCSQKIAELGFKNYTIRVDKNTVFREADCFYKDIVQKMDTLDGLTFFAHSKGISNHEGDWYGTTEKSLTDWILGMYFFSLEHIDMLEDAIYNRRDDFYGSFLCECKEHNENEFIYSGTFYWMNCPAIAMQMKKVPLLYDMTYAEDFPGRYGAPLLYHTVNGKKITGHGLSSYKAIYFTEGANFYKQMDDILDIYKEFDHDVYDDYMAFKQCILKSIHKYSILTCLFGEYEDLKEVKDASPNVEYICVTDNPNLASNTWTIVYADEFLRSLPFVNQWTYVRYHPYEFVSNDMCVYIDGSVEIVKDFTYPLIDEFAKSKCKYGVMIHPWRDTLQEETNTWMSADRGYSAEMGEKTFKYLNEHNYDVKGLIQSTILLSKRGKDTDIINNRTWELCHLWGDEKSIDRNNQGDLTYIINTLYFNSDKIMFLSPQVICSDYMHWYDRSCNTYWGWDGLNSGYAWNKENNGFDLIDK